MKPASTVRLLGPPLEKTGEDEVAGRGTAVDRAVVRRHLGIDPDGRGAGGNRRAGEVDRSAARGENSVLERYGSQVGLDVRRRANRGVLRDHEIQGLVDFLDDHTRP